MPGYDNGAAERMRNVVKMMKLIAIFTILANLFGCEMTEPHMLDGPGMVYVDSEYRTEYANTLPFDELEGYPYCAVVFLGKGEIGEANRKKYIDKLFSNLSEESLSKIKHFDFEGDEWYLIIPRYWDEYDIVPLYEETKNEYVMHGEPFTVKCKANIKITYSSYDEHELSPQTDDNGKLICNEDIWDITEYEQ